MINHEQIGQGRAPIGIEDGVQSKEEGCSLSFGALRPNFPAVPMDDALHGCQTDACSWKFVLTMKSLKGAKKGGRIFHIKSSPVVVYEIGLRAITFA